MSVIKFKNDFADTSYDCKIQFEQLKKLSEEISFSRREIVNLETTLQEIENNIASFLDQDWQTDQESQQHLNNFMVLYQQLIDFTDNKIFSNFSNRSLNYNVIKNLSNKLSKIENYISGSSTYVIKTPAERIASIANEYDELLERILPLTNKKIMGLSNKQEILYLVNEVKKTFSSAKMQKEHLIEEIKENIIINLQENSEIA